MKNGGPRREAGSLDRTDRRILALTQANARLPNKDIARQVHLSATPCLRRINLLEKSGFIERYKAILDPSKLGFSIHAFLGVKRSRESNREEVAEQILAIPEVLSCHIVSGEFDLLVEIVARDMDDYARLAIDTIAGMPGVYDLRSTFSIKALKMNGDLPVDEPDVQPAGGP